MAAITDSISSGAGALNSLFGKLQRGSTASTTEDTALDDAVQESLKTVKGINESVGSTVKALRLLKSQTNTEFVDVNASLIELEALSQRILDPKDEVNKDDAERFQKLSSEIDKLIEANLDTNVTDDSTLQDFLFAFEKQRKEVTLASTKVSDQVDEATGKIGEDFGGFLSDNISKISTSQLGSAASEAAIATLAGPFAPVALALKDLVDPSALFDGAKDLFGKGQDLLKKKQADDNVKALVSTGDDSVDLSLEEGSSDTLSDRIESLQEQQATSDSVSTKMDKLSSKRERASLKAQIDEKGDTEQFRAEQVEMSENNAAMLDDRLSDIAEAVDDSDGGIAIVGGLGAIAARIGAILGPIAAIAGAAAVGFGVGTVINDKLNAVTGGEFGATIGDSIGPVIDEGLAFFGNEAAKDRLAIIDKLDSIVERKDESDSITNDLVDEATSTGFLGFGGFDKEDFDSSANELKSVREQASGTERVDLANDQIQTLQGTLDSNDDLDINARFAIKDLIKELEDEKATVLAEVQAQQVPSIIETPIIETPDQVSPLVQPAQRQATAGSVTINQPKQAESVKSMPMVNDDMGLQLVNSGII